MKTEEVFEELKKDMSDCLLNEDTETAHMAADALLIDIALNTKFTKAQRTELVDIYYEVNKWYA